MKTNELIELRRTIHKFPDLSGKETQTAKRIESFVKKFSPNQTITNLGGSGIAFVFEGNEDGKTIMFRAELDALPIQESNEFEHKSVVEGVSHKCGHDGHMTILAGLASSVSDRIFKGKVILLFQPAEETGEGALRILQDQKFEDFHPDYIFALHNLPGYPVGSLILKKDTFAAASKGMIINLKGKTAHAAEPELGNNPAFFISDFLVQLDSIKKSNNFSDFTLATVIHLSVGSPAFGTSPGDGKVMLTLRSFLTDDMNKLTNSITNLIEKLSAEKNISYEISFTEEFPPTINNSDAVETIKKAADQLSIPVIDIETPFKWSEDFGYFTSKFKGAFFGIGSGEEHPNLHNHSYDFPDILIDNCIKIFYQIIKNVD